MHKSKLPGSLNKHNIIEEIIRVDHAGEYGAKRIYEGQLAVLRSEEDRAKVQHMKDQELEHLAYFEKQIVQRQVRPTLLQPLWHVAGFALGAATALLGPKAAMACTVAVEEVISEHYLEQLQQLQEDEPELREKIEKFRQEELEHHETGLENGAKDTVFYDLLAGAIKFASKAAIMVAKKI